MTSSSFRLIERTGPNPGQTHELNKDSLTIGRDVTNDIVIADAEVSRQHARINRTPGGHVLEDLGSTNGTFVNGERLVSPRVLNPGDLVGLGENVTLTFNAEAAESAATVMAPGGEPQALGQQPGQAQQGGGQPAQQAQPAAQAQSAAPAAPAAEEEGGGAQRWILAGCGCLLLLGVCGGAFWFLDANYPDLIYGPIMPILRAIGLG
ncbi:MAG: FHA domain-containing protein [Anaerolineales bacterium]|nr:FHA domain-containing protein [Anaerolineales bacterium]